MATTGIILGRNYNLFSNTVKITHLTSCSLTVGTETIDLTSNDSANWKDIAAGDKSWSFEFEAHLAMDGAENVDELFADWDARTLQTCLLTTAVTGDTTFSGSAIITSLSIDNSHADSSKLKGTYSGSDTLTIGVVS